MLTRTTGYLTVRTGPVPPASEQLQAEGWARLVGVLGPDEVVALAADIDRVFDEEGPDERVPGREEGHYEPFRYAMLNRSAACQRALAAPAILEVIEPLLGEDCHVIANTAWRQPPGPSDHGGRKWHIDSGPHLPRPEGVPWDDRIPYPIFAIAAHILLTDLPLEAGPTAVIPRSHRSGQAPPYVDDADLTCEGVGALPVLGQAGDVVLFVSDVWHTRLPPAPDGGPGRYFLQVHYGRRDLAQRLLPTSEANQLSPDALGRATAASRREQALVGLHRPGFYDG